MREWFSEKYDVPVWIDNDVNMMAVGEMKAGAGRGQHNLIYLNMSETIRAGIVSNGRLHRGEQGTAGEIGHVSVVEEPPIPCWCGGTGCLVRFAGGDVLAASATLLAGHDDGILADRIGPKRPPHRPGCRRGGNVRRHRECGPHQPGRNTDR